MDWDRFFRLLTKKLPDAVEEGTRVYLTGPLCGQRVLRAEIVRARGGLAILPEGDTQGHPPS